METKSHWIVRSNRAFDKIGDIKLLVLILFIVIAEGVDWLYFDGHPYVFGGVAVIFIAWRLLGFRINDIEKARNKDGQI